jgi:exodeoxyribonuclease-3
VSHKIGEKKGYSGVVTMVRDEIASDAKEIHTHYELLPDEATKEGRVCMIQIDAWCIINVYTPNSGAADLKRLDYRVEVWDPAFLRFVKANISEHKQKIIVCGDLNVARTEKDIARPSSNKNSAGFTERERASFETFLSKAKVDDVFRRLKGPDIQEYTYWSYMGQARKNNVGWRIDYVLIPQKTAVHALEYQSYKDTLGSDHCPVMVTLNK